MIGRAAQRLPRPRDTARTVAYSPARTLGLPAMRTHPWVAAALLGLVAQQPTAEDLRDRLDAYLRDYQDRLSAIVATETLVQETAPRPVLGQRLPTFVEGAKRRLESEVSFGTLPGEDWWLGFRHVLRRDGQTLSAVTSVDDLLRGATPLEAARTMLAESARHNLGSYRNTNLPNLPLELLHPRHRDRFDMLVKGTARVRGTPVTVAVFSERARPSIVKTPDGIDLVSTVTAWVESTGRLLEAEVRSRPDRRPGRGAATMDAVVRVRFGPHKELGLFVPLEMREEFWHDDEERRGTGVAKYSNFRRFGTSARILPPR